MFTGDLTGVNGKQLTVTRTEGKNTTVRAFTTLPKKSDVRVTVNGKKAALSDLKNGDSVTVFGPDDAIHEVRANR